jgi:hypothetical protein
MEPGVPASTTALAGTVAPTGLRTVRLLAVMGLVGAIGTLAAAVATLSQWGSPGTAAYTAYEAANRLVAFLILPMIGAPLAMRVALATRGLRGRTAMLVATMALLVASVGTATEFVLFSTAPYQGPGSEGRLAAYLSFFVAGLVFLGAVGRVGFVLRHHSPSWVAPLLLVCPVLGFGISLAGGSLFFGTAITTAALAVAADAIARSGGAAQVGVSEPATGAGA